MFSPNELQRLSYEQNGSKQAFAFRHAQSGIFWFCFFESKRNPKDFAVYIKIHKPYD